MLLEEKVNILISKIIGLSNGIYDLKYDPKYDKDIRLALKSIKDNSNLDYYIDLIKLDKEELLPDCMICLTPCGRTSDYLINEIVNEELRDKKIKELNEIINNYELLDRIELLKKLCSLSF